MNESTHHLSHAALNLWMHLKMVGMYNFQNRSFLAQVLLAIQSESLWKKKIY